MRRTMKGILSAEENREIMEGPYVVIKVKYGDMLRRFNVQVVKDEFNMSIDALREKIISLFGFSPASELTLTYIDEDGDVVTLSDDDELRDVVIQELNPLRITVKLINENKIDQPKNNSSGSSTPRSTSTNQQPLQNSDSLVHEVMRNVPEPVREMLVGLSNDLTSKASSTSPLIAGIVDVFAKVCSSYMEQPSAAQTATEDKISVDPNFIDAMNASLKQEPKEKHSVSMQSLEKLEREENVNTNGVKKLDNVESGNSEGSSSKAFDHRAVAAALESLDIEAFSSGSTLLHPFKSNLMSGVGKKGKAKKEMMRKIFEKHLSKKHHLPLLPLLHGKKHWGFDNSDEYYIPSDNSPAGSHSNDIEKEINKPNGGSVSNVNPFQNPTYVDPKMPEFPSEPIAKDSSSSSGTSTQNVSAIPPHTAFEPFPLVRGTRLQDGNGVAIHLGVRCDGCRIYPITGPRFKSKVKVDYDLCQDCFKEIGNDTDYIRMDSPAVYHYQMPSKEFNELAKGTDPTLPQVYVGAKVKPTESELDSRFVQDVNIVDGTVLAPSVPFTKIWQMRNNGTAAWPPKTQLVWVGGDKLSNALSLEVYVPPTGLLPDHVLDVAVDLISPELPGRYISYWRLASPSGQKFGQRIWVLIQVDASLRMTQQGGDRGFNLNLPPTLLTPEIAKEMMTTDDMKELEPNSSKKPMETVEPDADSKQTTYDHELKFPINDSLLVGSGASNLKPPSTSSVSYPILDPSDLTPPPPPHYAASQGNEYVIPPPPPLYYAASQGNQFYVPPPPPPPQPLPSGLTNINLEEDLLRKLEEMGFNSVGLNKEVLRLTGYDLVQAIDVLSGLP